MPTVLLSGCAILKQGELLLIRKKDREFWELPGGRVSSDEAEQVAAAKTKEQIGVEPTIIQQFTLLEYQKDENNIEASIFECEIDPEAKFVPGENIEEIKWFSVSGLKEGKENIGDDVKEILEEI
jgi:ADP-ribose pyrophosphatase YjhB (NUDIX family)